VAQDYWGNGVNIRDTGFLHGSEVLKDCVIIPRINDTLIHQICMVLALKDTPFGKAMVLDVNQEDIPLLKQVKSGLHFRDFRKSNVYGGPKSAFVRTSDVSKDLGFSPSIVRGVNRIYHEEANVDIEMMEMLGETNGLIVGSKWGEAILKIVNKMYPDIKWKAVENIDSVNPGEFANASFVIGTQDSNAWVGSMFVHCEHAKVIEIAYEHDTTPHWYHLVRGVGAKYSVIPLKNEPKKKCLERIQTNLKHYLVKG
jgi:hypothetical protein